MKTILIFFLLIGVFSCNYNQLPEPSMEKELLIGDFLFIEKLSYEIKDSAKNKFDYDLIHNDSLIDTKR